MMKNIKILATYLFFAYFLSACDSGLNGQIEKCVQAAMASEVSFKNSQEKAGYEATARAYCLRAAAGKD